MLKRHEERDYELAVKTDRRACFQIGRLQNAVGVLTLVGVSCSDDNRLGCSRYHAVKTM